MASSLAFSRVRAVNGTKVLKGPRMLTLYTPDAHRFHTGRERAAGKTSVVVNNPYVRLAYSTRGECWTGWCLRRNVRENASTYAHFCAGHHTLRCLTTA